MFAEAVKQNWKNSRMKRLATDDLSLHPGILSTFCPSSDAEDRRVRADRTDQESVTGNARLHGLANDTFRHFLPDAGRPRGGRLGAAALGKVRSAGA